MLITGPAFPSRGAGALLCSKEKLLSVSFNEEWRLLSEPDGREDEFRSGFNVLAEVAQHSWCPQGWQRGHGEGRGCGQWPGWWPAEG